jgi:hypothetical protein
MNDSSFLFGGISSPESGGDSSWHSLANDDDDNFQMYLDSLQNLENDNRDGSRSFPFLMEDETFATPRHTTTTATTGVCFSDTVQELSASGQISQVPLKDHTTSTGHAYPFPQNAASEYSQQHDSGSLQSLNLWDDEDTSTAVVLEGGDEALHTSSIRDMIRQAVLEAWSEDDDDNHVWQDHSASQQGTTTILPRARHPGLTLQYVFDRPTGSIDRWMDPLTLFV